MTKEKIKKTLKKLPEILQELKSGQNKKPRRKKRNLVIDEDVLIIVEIIEEIIENEETDWVKKWLRNLSKGLSDTRLLLGMPISRAEYYLIKNRLVDKIYSCCVYKGLVEYKDILKERIG